MKITKELLTEMIEEEFILQENKSIPGFNLKIRVGEIRRLVDEIGLQPDDQQELDKLLKDRSNSEMLDLRKFFGEKPYMKWTPSPRDKYHKAKKTTFTKNPGKGYFGAWFAIARAITHKVFSNNPELESLDRLGKKLRRQDPRGDVMDFKTDYAYMVGRGMLSDWKESYRLRDEIQDRVTKLVQIKTEGES